MAKLIIALMYGNKKVLDRTISILKKIFGEIDLSIGYDFNFTEYYRDEFGENLRKKIISFRKPTNKGLAEIKILTNKIEKEFSANKKRIINIDPGYVTMHNLVLASVKESPHRVNIGRGIYAESILFFKNKQFNEYYYTFQDYRQEKVKLFFKEVRDSIRNH